MAGQNMVKTVNNIIKTRMMISKYSKGPKLLLGPVLIGKLLPRAIIYPL